MKKKLSQSNIALNETHEIEQFLNKKLEKMYVLSRSLHFRLLSSTLVFIFNEILKKPTLKWLLGGTKTDPNPRNFDRNRQNNKNEPSSVTSKSKNHVFYEKSFKAILL